MGRHKLSYRAIFGIPKVTIKLPNGITLPMVLKEPSR